jgi:hypothetical protein
VAAGQYANVGFSSYLVVGRETTFGTYSTCTAGIDFMSASFTTKKESKVIEAVRNSRTFVDRVGLGKVVEGELEFYMASDSDAAQYIMQNAFGGGVTGGTIVSATTSGDTTGAGVFDHVYSLAGFDATYSSLCFNHRKGDATNGKIFEYSGARVNEFSLKAEIDDALMASASFIMVDSTVTTNTAPAAALTPVGQTPLSFVNMRFSVENSFASLTASAFWHVQSIEFSMKNSLKSDADARRIGSELLQVLPPGPCTFDLGVSMRFDTLTAYNAMLNETQLSAQMIFEGATISGSKMKRLVQIDLPRVYISDSGDPEIGGPDEILKAEVAFMVLQDDSTTTGYACKATVRNTTSSY